MDYPRPDDHVDTVENEAHTLPGWLAAPHAALVTQRPEAGRASVRAWIVHALAEGWKVYAKHPHPDRASTIELATLTGSDAATTEQAEILDARVVHAATGGKRQALSEWHTSLLAQYVLGKWRRGRVGRAHAAISCVGVRLRMPIRCANACLGAHPPGRARPHTLRG
jgi:hypothetical protein